MSGDIYAEYEEVISRPRLQRSEDIVTSALQAIRENSFWIRSVETVRACSDPDDDIFLECAQAVQADYLVTWKFQAPSHIVGWRPDSDAALVVGSFVGRIDREGALAAVTAFQSGRMRRRS